MKQDVLERYIQRHTILEEGTDGWMKELNRRLKTMTKHEAVDNNGKFTTARLHSCLSMKVQHAEGRTDG